MLEALKAREVTVTALRRYDFAPSALYGLLDMTPGALPQAVTISRLWRFQTNGSAFK